MHQRGGVRAVQRLHPDQNVRDRRLQAHEFDALAGKAGLAGIDPPALEQHAGELFLRWRGDVARVVGEFQHDRQPHAGVDRGAPQHFITAWCRLVELEVGRARIVCLRDRAVGQRCQNDQEQQQSRKHQSSCAVQRGAAALGHRGARRLRSGLRQHDLITGSHVIEYLALAIGALLVHPFGLDPRLDLFEGRHLTGHVCFDPNQMPAQSGFRSVPATFLAPVQAAPAQSSSRRCWRPDRASVRHRNPGT